MRMILNDVVMYNKYEDFMVRRVLATDPDTRWCPQPDCGWAFFNQDARKILIGKISGAGLLSLPPAALAAQKSDANDHAVRACFATTAKLTGTLIRLVMLPAPNANPRHRPIQSAPGAFPLHFSLRRLPQFLAFPLQVRICFPENLTRKCWNCFDSRRFRYQTMSKMLRTDC